MHKNHHPVAWITLGCLLPGVARADALDAMWIVAAAMGFVWLMFVLLVFGMACATARVGPVARVLGIAAVWVTVSPPILLVLQDAPTDVDTLFMWGVCPIGVAAAETWWLRRLAQRPPEA